jgi:aminopeptidase YwaD
MKKDLRLISCLFVLLSSLNVFAAEPAVLETVSKESREFKIEARAEGLPKEVTFKAKDLFEHAQYLAGEECEGRLAGSPGETKAREYIIKHMKKAGFEDARRMPFEFIADMKMRTDNALDVKTAAGITQHMIDKDFRPFRISKRGLAEGELVFAGYGISAPEKDYDDYKDLDVKGKIVLILRHEPETADGKRIGGEKVDPHHGGWGMYSDFFYKASTARDKGAAAVVIVNGARGLTDAERNSLNNFERGVGGKTDCGIPFIQITPDTADLWLKSLGKSSAELQKAIDEKIAPQSAVIPGTTVHMNVDVSREHATSENVAFIIPGTDPVLRKEIVVVGAHYDHLGRGNEFSLAGKDGIGQIHGGADDNASGVSSVIELAEALHKNRQHLKRTIWIMFFGAEELGTLGSMQFVKSPPPDFDLKNVNAMLNLDMVGRCREKNLMVEGVGTGSGLEAIVDASARNLGLNIKKRASGYGPSDHTAFVAAGIPVLFFYTGAHSEYHKPSDTADKLNVADQAVITSMVFQICAAVINAPERAKYVKIDPPKMGAGSGMGGLRLGTIPDYAYEGKGMRISGVVSGTPAEKVAMKNGDIVIKLGGVNVENVYDFMNAMRRLTAGVETEMVLTRDGKEMTMKIAPEKR